MTDYTVTVEENGPFIVAIAANEEQFGLGAIMADQDENIAIAWAIKNLETQPRTT